MNEVRIFRPAKNAMQSGRAKVRTWVLEPEPGAAKRVDPLTGWTGSADTLSQVRMKFDTRQEAVAFAEKKGWSFKVQEPNHRSIQGKNYSENFAFNKVR